jgi:hypothetical protein
MASPRFEEHIQRQRNRGRAADPVNKTVISFSLKTVESLGPPD